MSEEKIESRVEEVARVRSYLASQAIRRTPAQIVETLRTAHGEFLEAVQSIPEAQLHTAPQAGEWSTAEVVLHVLDIANFDTQTIVPLLKEGVKPDGWQSNRENPWQNANRQTKLAALTELREQLMAAALEADPEAYLEVTWGHAEFGQMNWREWLLFARVHTLDHVRQVQTIAKVISV